MNTKLIIRTAMAQKDIKGIMQLVEVTGVSFGICHKLLTNNKTCTLKSLEAVLSALNYQLTAQPQKECK